MEELADDVIEPVDFAAGNLQIVVELAQARGVIRLCLGIFDGCGLGRGRVGIGGAQLFQFTLHQLQVNVQRVERIADLVRDTRGEQRQRLDAFALDDLDGLLLLLGGVVDDHRQPTRSLAHQRRSIYAQVAPDGITRLQLMARHRHTVGGGRRANIWPINLGQKIRHRPPFGILERQAQ